MASSLLVENAARGLKVLICDFYGQPWSLDIGEPMALSNQEHSYTKFENVVTKILSQSNSEYFDERRKQIDFLMTENNFNSVKEYINSILTLKQ